MYAAPKKAVFCLLFVLKKWNRVILPDGALYVMPFLIDFDQLITLVITLS